MDQTLDRGRQPVRLTKTKHTWLVSSVREMDLAVGSFKNTKKWWIQISNDIISGLSSDKTKKTSCNLVNQNKTAMLQWQNVYTNSSLLSVFSFTSCIFILVSCKYVSVNVFVSDVRIVLLTTISG